MATLQAELARAQQEKAKQEEKIANYEEQRQQLHWELRKLQGSQEQSKQEVCPKPPRVHQEPTLSQSHCLCHPQAQSLRERLQELSSQAQHWQQLHQDSEQALAAREEELVVCKVELAFLKEELSKAMEQVQDGKKQHAAQGQERRLGPAAREQQTLAQGREAGQCRGQHAADPRLLSRRLQVWELQG